MQLIERIAKTNQFLPLCQLYAKREWKRDELHQEFLLRLLEIGEDKVVEANNGGYLDWYCFDIIGKIWANRNRVKCYEKGKTNPLYELTGVIEMEVQEEIIEDLDNIDFDFYTTESINQIQNDIYSDDMILNFSARIFAYSVGLKIDNGVVSLGGDIKSIRQFAKLSKIPMSASHSAFVRYKKLLRDKLNV